MRLAIIPQLLKYYTVRLLLTSLVLVSFDQLFYQFNFLYLPERFFYLDSSKAFTMFIFILYQDSQGH